MASPARHLRRLLPLRSARRHVPSPPHHPLLQRRRHQPRQPDHGLLELPPQNPPPQLAHPRARRRQPHTAPARRPDRSHATPPRARLRRRLSARTRAADTPKAETIPEPTRTPRQAEQEPKPTTPATSQKPGGHNQTRQHNTPDQNPRQRPGDRHAVVNPAPNKTAGHQPDQSRHLIEGGHKTDPKARSDGWRHVGWETDRRRSQDRPESMVRRTRTEATNQEDRTRPTTQKPAKPAGPEPVANKTEPQPAAETRPGPEPATRSTPSPSSGSGPGSDQGRSQSLRP